MDFQGLEEYQPVMTGDSFTLEGFHSDLSHLFLDRVRRVRSPIIAEVGSREARDGVFLFEYLQGAELHIFEPNPDAIPLCQDRVDAWRKTRGAGSRRTITLCPLAVTDSEGTMDFHCIDPSSSPDADIGLSSLMAFDPAFLERRGIRIRTVSVRTTTLNRYFSGRPPPSVLRIDVEGAELAVLRGADGILGSVEVLELEVGFRPNHMGQALFWEIDTVLRRQGFELLGFPGVSPWRSWLTRHRLWPNPPRRWNAIYHRSTA